MRGGFENVYLTWWFRVTAGERISRVSIGTSAHRRVVYDRAIGAQTARAGARVATFLRHASLVAGTLWIDRALGTTIRRTANKSGKARTRRHAADVSALRVKAARRGYAWISVRFLLGWGRRR
jgi:hypothetical protein